MNAPEYQKKSDHTQRARLAGLESRRRKLEAYIAQRKSKNDIARKLTQDTRDKFEARKAERLAARPLELQHSPVPPRLPRPPKRPSPRYKPTQSGALAHILDLKERGLLGTSDDPKDLERLASIVAQATR